MRSSAIVLVPKTDDNEELQHLNKWRPISLLNVDYKLMSKMLATRIAPMLSDIVSPCQVYASRGRSIRDHLFRLQQLIYIAFDRNAPQYWINYDLEKAFDRVNRHFLSKVLVHLNFPLRLIRAIETLYFGATAYIHYNHKRTEDVYVRSGLRQGCPVSAALFALYTSPLLHAIDNSAGIKGISFGPALRTCKIVAYADDMYLTVESCSSILTANKILEEFSRISGCQINLSKSKATVWSSSPLIVERLPNLGLTWTINHMKALGIPFYDPRRVTAFASGFWNERLNKIHQLTSIWSRRNISLIGRARVWNSVILATFQYYIPFIPIPARIFKVIDRCAALFIWRHASFEYCRRSNLMAPTNMAGLGLHSLRTRWHSILLRILSWRTLLSG